MLCLQHLRGLPKGKIALCICAAENLFFWINSNRQRHAVGQILLMANEHGALSHDCFLDCSRVTTFRPDELSNARDRGPISVDLALGVVTMLRDHPPKTLSNRYAGIAIENLSALIV